MINISCPIYDTHLVSDMWGATHLNGASTSYEGPIKCVNDPATGTNMSALCFLKECKTVIFIRLPLYNKHVYPDLLVPIIFTCAVVFII